MLLFFVFGGEDFLGCAFEKGHTYVMLRNAVSSHASNNCPPLERISAQGIKIL